MNLTPSDDARSFGRLAARLSAICAFVCFTMNCVLNQFLLRGEPAAGQTWNLAVGSLSTFVVLVGIGLGIVGLASGIRRRSLDTSTVALVGLLLNLGIIFVMLWGLYVLASARDR